MENKIFGLLGGQIKKNIVAELHELIVKAELRHFADAEASLADILKNEEFDVLYVDMPLRLRVMPLMSKTSPQARLGGGVDLVLRMPNGKLYGHNTEIYGFSYLLDSSCIDVKDKKCMILGNGLDAAAVYNVLKVRGASEIALISRDKYAGIAEHSDTEIVIVTSKAEKVSLDEVAALQAVIDIRPDRLNSEFAENKSVVSVNGYNMAAAKVKFARECMSGVEMTEDELTIAVQKLTEMRTSIILAGTDLAELGRNAALRMGRRFYDLNETIERLNGKSIEQIKRDHGDAELLRMKRVAAEWAAKQTGVVITVDETLKDLSLLKRNGVVISVPDGVGNDTEAILESIVKSLES